MKMIAGAILLLAAVVAGGFASGGGEHMGLVAALCFVVGFAYLVWGTFIERKKD